MNILKKTLAPITDKGWEEITEQLDEMLFTMDLNLQVSRALNLHLKNHR